MERWAKVPISWAGSEMVCDPIRVWLAISDQTRGARRMKIEPEHIQRSTKLAEARVSAGFKALEEMGAISVENGVVDMKPSLSRAPVDRTPLKNISLEHKRESKEIVEGEEKGGSTRMRVEDTFEERNRLAKVRTKAIKWINDYFEDPSWQKVNRKKRFWGRLQGLFKDELAPSVLRVECETILRERAQREYRKREEKGEQSGPSGLHRESRDHSDGEVDYRDGAGLPRPRAGVD